MKQPSGERRPARTGNGLSKVRSRAATRRFARLELPPAVAALLTEATTVDACLGMAEQMARTITRNLAAIRVGVDPEALVASAEEVDLQLYREVLEGPARERFEQISAEFVGWRNASPDRGSVVWKDCTGDIADCIRHECDGIDLIVTAHPGNLDGRDALHFALFHSGKLVGVAPRVASSGRLLDHVVVGWKPHANAYATIEAARTWLRAASRITVLCVDDREDGSYRKTASALFSSLSLRCDVLGAGSGDVSVGECLLRQATDLNASCLVIGAYRHGPLLELVLGRVTRHVLEHASTPLLMKH